MLVRNMIPKPTCDRCNQPVDEMLIEHLPSIGVRVTVKHHGEEEAMALSHREFLGLKQGIVEARAFRQSGPRVVVHDKHREGGNDA